MTASSAVAASAPSGWTRLVPPSGPTRRRAWFLLGSRRSSCATAVTVCPRRLSCKLLSSGANPVTVPAGQWGTRLEDHRAGKIAVLAGRRGRLQRISDRDGQDEGPPRLRQRRLRQVAGARRLHGDRRGGHLPSPRCPLPRPRSVLLCPDLCAEAAAGAGPHLG